MNLARVQMLSLATKAVTLALGIVQAFFVIHFLSRAEYGLVGLVMSIGSVIGVTQHLGVVDGAIREIAVLKKREEIGKVFWVAHLVRQAVTVPLTLGLMALAGVIAARIYGRPEITMYIQIFAASLILQGLQDVLGATLTGMKKFAELYAVQIVTALINIAAFGLLTWQYGVAGFFWAVIVTTSIMVVIYAVIIARHLGSALRWPSQGDIRRYTRQVMRVAGYMYIARILFVVWQRLPLLILGGVVAADQLGDLNLALTFGSKLTIVAMALSEVNLSLMSALFATRRQEFAHVVTRNMRRVLVLLAGLALLLIFFAPEILHIPILLEYLPAQGLVVIMTLAFFLYALLDIGTSSVFVSADRPHLRALIYAVMNFTSVALIGGGLLWRPSPTTAALGVLAGAMAAYAVMVTLAQRTVGVRLLTVPLALLLVLLASSAAWLLTEPVLPVRIVVFLLLAGYVLYEARRSRLLPAFAKASAFAKATADESADTSADSDLRIICFAGAAYDAPSWTNRQHIMSRVSRHVPVLYIEPRVWIVRYIVQHWREPAILFRFVKRVAWHDQRGEQLYIKSQWNVLPGSREYRWIARINHWLNRWNVLMAARRLGFGTASRLTAHSAANASHGVKLVAWIYDTEAAEYVDAFSGAVIIYDCVDDHAAQAGVDRNPRRVEEEEEKIMTRADLVTVTSRRLYELKKAHARRVELVLNAGDTAVFVTPPDREPTELAAIPRPRLGTVGALDDYKFDFGMLRSLAAARPQWQLVFIGAPVVDQRTSELQALASLPNVHVLGPRPRHEVPAYVHHFDVCLIPYHASRYNEASFPLKFWEFMATGRPVVAAGVPELSAYRELIGYAEGAEDFITEIERALRSPAVGRERRIALAREHSWEQRTARLLLLVREITR